MPPLDFPPGTPGATYTGPNGVIWSWDGAKWLAGTSANVYAGINSPVFTGDPQAPQPAAGDSDASIATTAFVTNAVATSLHDVGRNYLHNSMFNVTQRGVAAFAIGYSADRWQLLATLDTVNVQPGTFGDAHRAQIGDEAATNLLIVNVTGNAGAGAYSFVNQPIEDVRRLAGKTVTISFWAAYTTGTSPKIGVGLRQYFGTGGSPSAAVDINALPVTLTTTYSRYSVTMALPSVSGKTLGTNNDHFTRLAFFVSSGANTNALAGGIGVQTWVGGIWGVQLELGPTATPLEKLDPVTQLQQCQRFYQVGWYNLSGYAASTGIGYQYFQSFPVVMRGTPGTPTNTPNQAINITGQGLLPNQYGIGVAAAGAAVGGFIFSGSFGVSADL